MLQGNGARDHRHGKPARGQIHRSQSAPRNPRGPPKPSGAGRGDCEGCDRQEPPVCELDCSRQPWSRGDEEAVYAAVRPAGAVEVRLAEEGEQRGHHACLDVQSSHDRARMQRLQTSSRMRENELDKQRERERGQDCGAAPHERRAFLPGDEGRCEPGEAGGECELRARSGRASVGQQ